MKYDHMVKKNGVYYARGEDVPEDNRNVASDENSMPHFVSDTTLEVNDMPQKQYTKTEIYKMNKAELQKMAANMGVNGAENMTGSDLKEYLLNVLGQ